MELACSYLALQYRGVRQGRLIVYLREKDKCIPIYDTYTNNSINDNIDSF